MRTHFLSSLSAAALAFWALVSIADQPVPTPPAATAGTAVTEPAQPNRLPDYRTMTRFPGP